MVNWSDYSKKAVRVLSHFSSIYSGVPRSSLAYYKENKECGEDEEEFILFLFQGVGLSFEEVRDAILVGQLEMSQEEAEAVMDGYPAFK